MSGSNETIQILRDLVLMIDESRTDQSVIEEARRLVEANCSVTPFESMQACALLKVVSGVKIWDGWAKHPGLSHSDAAKAEYQKYNPLGVKATDSQIIKTRHGSQGAITTHSVKRRVRYESTIVYSDEDLAPGGCRGPELAAELPTEA